MISTIARPIARLDTGYVSPPKPTPITQLPDSLPGTTGTSTVTRSPARYIAPPPRVYPETILSPPRVHEPISSITLSPARITEYPQYPQFSPIRDVAAVAAPAPAPAYASTTTITAGPAPVAAPAVVAEEPRVVHPAPPVPPAKISVGPTRFVGTSPIVNTPNVPTTPIEAKTYIGGVTTSQGVNPRLRLENGTATVY